MGKDIILIKQTAGGGGGGTINGSIAANQVAIGSGANTISGSNNFTYDPASGLLTVKDELGNIIAQFYKTNIFFGDLSGATTGAYFGEDISNSIAFFVNAANTAKFGVNTNVPRTTIDIAGSVSAKIIYITDSDSPYTVLNSDFTILCDTSSGDITVNLPQTNDFDGRLLNIKNVGTNANTLSILPIAGNNIDGLAGIGTTTPMESFALQCGGIGLRWSII